jgi:preprotein translocase subunit YajC
MLTALVFFAQEGAKGQTTDAPVWIQFAPFILMIVLFYFLMIAPARRKERQQRELLNTTLKKNDRVLTNAGIIGTVANIKDDEVTLKLEEGRVRILKSTIARILSAEEPGKEPKAEAAK